MLEVVARPTAAFRELQLSRMHLRICSASWCSGGPLLSTVSRTTSCSYRSSTRWHPSTRSRVSIRVGQRDVPLRKSTRRLAITLLSRISANSLSCALSVASGESSSTFFATSAPNKATALYPGYSVIMQACTMQSTRPGHSSPLSVRFLRSLRKHLPCSFTVDFSRPSQTSAHPHQPSTAPGALSILKTTM